MVWVTRLIRVLNSFSTFCWARGKSISMRWIEIWHPGQEVVAQAFNLAFGRQRQADLWISRQPGIQSNFQDIQGYTEKSYLKKTRKKVELKCRVTWKMLIHNLVTWQGEGKGTFKDDSQSNVSWFTPIILTLRRTKDKNCYKFDGSLLELKCQTLSQKRKESWGDSSELKSVCPASMKTRVRVFKTHVNARWLVIPASEDRDRGTPVQAN